MNELDKKEMYIIQAECYKCYQPMNVAIVKDDNGNYFRGPETFSLQEQKLAKDNQVTIKPHYSYTREETYYANTCTQCNAFIGQHFLLTEYLVPTESGEYEFKIVNI